MKRVCCSERFGLAGVYLRVLVLPLTLCSVSCHWESPSEVAEAVHTGLETLPQERVMRTGDLRDTRTLPAGDHVVDIGEYREGQLVRLGFAPRGVPTKPLTATVSAGDVVIDRIEIRRLMEWTDAVVDVSAQAVEHDKIRVRFSSDTPLHISRCDLSSQWDGRPNVLVFLVDTLRRDHLGCYGYPRDTSPHFDRLASDGVRFERMISHSSWTRPAVASLLTGTYPVVHGANDRSNVIRRDLITLAEVFRDAGYRTQAYMSNPMCLPMWGFGKGFTRFLDVNCFDIQPDKDAEVIDAVLATLSNLQGDPWFLYVHAIGPHGPYERREGGFSGAPPGHGDSNPLQQAAVNAYDDEIRFTDSQFGRLIQGLHANGAYDNTAIVVISDHGEQFWEHGQLGHGLSLHDEEVRVPTIIKLPNGESSGRVVQDVSELIDVGPTLLALAGLSAPSTFQGHPLLPQVPDEDAIVRPAYMSLYLEKQAQFGVRSASTKFIRDLISGSTSWYDLATDPDELRPLSGEPADGKTLERYAERVNASSGDGLYVMVTGSLLEPHTITGTIRGAELSEAYLHYEARNGKVVTRGDELTFRVTTSPSAEAPADLTEWHEDGAEQNHGILKVKLNPSRPVRISIALDGDPAPASTVFVGPEQLPMQLDNTLLDPTELAARPAEFAPMTLPRRLATYVWYVPDVASIADEALEPDMAGALEALGYL